MTSEVLGKVLRSLWESRGFSTRGFAEEIGLSRETLRLYGSGARTPSNKTLLRILDVLGICKDSDEAGTVFSCLKQMRTKDIDVHLTSGLPSPNLEKKLDMLVDLFFEHSSRERSDSLEHFIRGKFKEIEESLQ